MCNKSSLEPVPTEGLILECKGNAGVRETDAAWEKNGHGKTASPGGQAGADWACESGGAFYGHVPGRLLGQSVRLAPALALGVDFFFFGLALYTHTCNRSAG